MTKSKIVSVAEDYTVKLWDIHEKNLSTEGRFIEEDLDNIPISISKIENDPNNFMLLFENNSLKYYDTRLHNPCVNTLQMPFGTTAAVFDDYNDRIIALHHNSLSFFEKSGESITTAKLKGFQKFSAFQKICHLLFIGIF